MKRDKILEAPDLLVRALFVRFNNACCFLHEVGLHVDHDLPIEDDPLLQKELDIIITEESSFINFRDHGIQADCLSNQQTILAKNAQLHLVMTECHSPPIRFRRLTFIAEVGPPVIILFIVSG